jgi:hypothetical protein
MRLLSLAVVAACAHPPQPAAKPPPPPKTSFTVTHRQGSTSKTTGDVEGVITHVTGPNPGVGLTVFISPSDLTRITDNAGRFRFTDLPPGTATLLVYSSDEMRATTVEVIAGMTAVSTIANMPDPTGGTLL